MALSDKACVECGTEVKMTDEEVGKTLKEVPEWRLEGKKIRRDYEFKDFKEAMSFVNKVADIAEENSHHPDFQIHWNKVSLELWTHSKDGLTENDFIVAAKIDRTNNNQ